MNKTIQPTQNKWNIRKNNEVNILYCNDTPTQCIYKMPVMLPHPNIQGQVIIQNPVCSDNCPMFNFTPGLFGKLKFECTKTEIEVYTFASL
jgi:hypothetical protein